MARLHLATFFENQDGAGALTNLAALNDPLSQLFQVQNSDFLRVPGGLVAVAGVYAGIDATVQPRARLTAPSFLERYGREGIEVPLLNSGAEPGSPPSFNDWRHDPIRVEPSEPLGFESLNNPGAAIDQFAVLWMTDGPVSRVDPRGGYWARFTTTAEAMNVNTWNARSLVADANLKPGMYEVLGMRAISTSLIASRLAFTGQVNKPGVLGADARADIPHAAMEPGAWGVLGEFDTDTLPQAEFLVDAADNEAQVVDLYIRRKGTRR